ncbi:MAG: hypothetical protein LBP79_06945 [Clostridiales bacterium]|nr:hypothetical protein [Clostridiales bacterium]
MKLFANLKKRKNQNILIAVITAFLMSGSAGAIVVTTAAKVGALNDYKAAAVEDLRGKFGDLSDDAEAMKILDEVIEQINRAPSENAVNSAKANGESKLREETAV